MSKTIITSRSVRTSITYKFCNFAYEAILENETGVSDQDIIEMGDNCTQLAGEAVKRFKEALAIELGIDVAVINRADKKTVQASIDDLKSSIGTKDNVSPDEAKRIAELPIYTAKAKADKKSVNKKP